MESSVCPGMPGGDHAEVLQDTAHDVIGLALSAEHFKLGHDLVECRLDLGDGAVGVAVAVTLQTPVAAFEFLAIEIRELGHWGQTLHSKLHCSDQLSQVSMVEWHVAITRFPCRQPPGARAGEHTADTQHHDGPPRQVRHRFKVQRRQPAVRSPCADGEHAP